MNIKGKLIIIGGAVDKGSFTETDLDKNAAKNLNFFEGMSKDEVYDHRKNKFLKIFKTAVHRCGFFMPLSLIRLAAFLEKTILN